MSVKIYFEVGHTATLKSKATPEGFTHDWELFVRGFDSANISRYVDKVVFILHESFPRPKRAVKEPPYILKESGYAGFELPIDIYFKGQGRDDPKKLSIMYDLNLQSNMSNHNVEKREYTFSNPSPELRRKLLDSGGIIVGTVGQLDDRSRDGVEEQRSQLISKPKLSGSDSKKHKNRPAPSDDVPKPTSTFANLFGTPITKMSTTKVSPDQKIGNSNSNSSSKVSGNSSSKQSSQKSSDKVSSKDKSDKSSKEKKDKSKYSSPLRESSAKESSAKKTGSSVADDKRGRDEEKRKEKSHTKERDRSKEKSLKRPPSPKPIAHSPPRTIVGRHMEVPAAVPPKHSADEKAGSGSGSSSKKSKKDKKDKEKDRERSGDKKDKEIKHQSKDRDNRPSSKAPEKVESKRDGGSSTPKEIAKDKGPKATLDAKAADSTYDQQLTEPKIPAMAEKPKSDKSDKDADRKHKHKKKDKNRDRGSGKERKKDKTAKQKDLNDNSHPATSVNKKSTANSHGQPTPPQPKKKPLGALMTEVNSDSSDSEMDGSSASPTAHTSKNHASINKPDVLDGGAADHSTGVAHLPDVVAPKMFLALPTQATSRSPVTKPEANGTKYADKASKRAAKEAKAAEKADKKRKRKDKDEQSHSGDDKRRATPSPINGPPPHKLAKKDEVLRMHQEKNGGDLTPSPSFGPSNSATISSPSPIPHHSNSNDHFASPSTANADTDTPLSGGEPYRSPNAYISIDYITELKALQHKIMALEDNSELQQVVEMIAATGCYEITSKTFDFDLCALDRTTVQRLQEFFAPTQSVL